MNDRTLGFSALAFAALMAWFGRDMVAPFAYEPVGPRAFPMLVALIIALCGAWLVYKNHHQAEKNPAGANSRISLMVVYTIAYAGLFQFLGFIIATTAMTVLVGRLFSGAWHKIFIGGAIMSILFFLLFDRALDIVLPLGLLENLI